MARAPDERVEKARKLYQKGKKLSEIAAKLGVPSGTVRRWKSTYKWDEMQESECSESEQKRSDKSERSDKKANAQKEEKEKAINEELELISKNSELTEKQRLFCMYYIRSFNATKSYQKAYQCSYQMACGHGHELLKNVEIKNEIMRLKQARINREFLSEHDIFQKYMDIAFSDITDYLQFGTEKIPVIGAFGVLKDKETGEPITKIVNTVRFKPSAEVDGTIISEVKQGRDGASIKLADRMKALDWLAAHMDLATAEQKAKIAQINAQTERLKQDNEQEELADDGFLQALEGNAAADWEGWTDEPDKES